MLAWTERWIMFSTIFWWTKWRPRPSNAHLSQTIKAPRMQGNASESFRCAWCMNDFIRLIFCSAFFVLFNSSRVAIVDERELEKRREKLVNWIICVCIILLSYVLKVFFCGWLLKCLFSLLCSFRLLMSEQKCERKPIFFLTSSDHLVFNFSPYDYVRARLAVSEILNIWTIFLLFYYVCVSAAIHLTTNRFERKSCVSKFWSGKKI